MAKLSEKEIKDISIGYNWNPDMSFEEFKDENTEININNDFELFNIIDRRYCEYVYEISVKYE